MTMTTTGTMVTMVAMVTMMTKTQPLRRFVAAVLLTLVAGSDAWAQDRPATDVVPLQVQVTISRYQGDALISSLPYILSVTADTPSCSLNMGADVAIATTELLVNQAGLETPRRSFSYRPVGVIIDCEVTTVADNRYQLLLDVEESTVYSEDQASTDDFEGQPVFRSFRSSNTMVLRDGRSRQVMAAVDRITGESVRIDVLLTVLE